MDPLAPALALALALACAIAVLLVVRSQRGRRRPEDRARLVEQALSRAREKQRTIADGAGGKDGPHGSHNVRG